NFNWKWQDQLYDLQIKVDQKIFKFPNDPLAKEDVSKLSDAIQELTVNDLTKKKSLLEVDLIINLTEIDICKHIVIPKLGIWSLAFGEHYNFNFRRGCFEHFLNNNPITKSYLIIQTADAPAGKIVYASTSTTHPTSLTRHQTPVAWKSILFFERILRQLSINDETVFLGKLPNLKLPTSTVRFSAFYTFSKLVRYALNGCTSKLHKFLFKEQWILLQKKAKDFSSDISTFRKIIPPKDRFWADPFLIQNENRQYLFFEELMYETDKGHLSVVEVNQEGTQGEPIKILDKPYHLSYPFIFEYEDKYWMIPESNESRNIQLYECEAFPHQWKHHSNLMEGIKAVDATVFFHNKKWWLFVNMAEQHGACMDDELFLFYADSPLTTDWTPHPLNPIISDVRLARCAGHIFEKDGKLYRPSQDGSWRYGYALNLNEILILNENEYQEKRVENVKPSTENGLTRIHTWNTSQELAVTDGVVYRFRFF
ncbi:MAG: hypothetical protein AAF573_18225, partial [Bacteroidota bacterium]